MSRRIRMWRRLPLDLRRYRHDLLLGGVLRDYIALLRRFALGFRLQERASLFAISIKNLREEVLIAVAMENQFRLRLSLAIDVVGIEVGRLVAVHAANDQRVKCAAGGEPSDRIFAGLELFVSNHEIEGDVRADPESKARKPDNCHGNDKGQCGDNAQYLLFQTYLRLVCTRLKFFAADFYLHKMRYGIPSPVMSQLRLPPLRSPQRRCSHFDAF